MSPLPANVLPYGLRDVKLTPYVAGVLGTAIDLPVSRTLSWSDSENFTALRGDDGIAAERGSGPQVAWDLEQGGISLAAYAALAGGTVTSSGTTPNLVSTYKKHKDDSRPYLKIEGQSISDNIGDFHVVLYRCRATGDIGGELSDETFLLTSCSGAGYPDEATGDVYDLVHNEEETDIA